MISKRMLVAALVALIILPLTGCLNRRSYCPPRPVVMAAPAPACPAPPPPCP